MTVDTILRQKGARVETATVETTLGAAARRLLEKGIGSLVVLDAGHSVVGVLGERDIMRTLVQYGADAFDLPVGAALDGPAATCEPTDSVKHVMSLMTMRRTRHVPVVADGALVGIVSIGDVVKSRLGELKLEVGVLRDYARAHG